MVKVDTTDKMQKLKAIVTITHIPIFSLAEKFLLS